MDVREKKLRVIGDAGLIGTHSIGEFARQDGAETRILDNFYRKRAENLASAPYTADDVVDRGATSALPSPRRYEAASRVTSLPICLVLEGLNEAIR